MSKEVSAMSQETVKKLGELQLEIETARNVTGFINIYDETLQILNNLVRILNLN